MCSECQRLEHERREEERRKKITEIESMLARGAKVARKVLKAFGADGWARERARLRPKG
jgi:hypothetical protein